ncbi:flagellin [Phreatobacter aquaticus]|uniref:Flagellin n=1 Tax=Phreatobacter aquaticus TaxID=2570229 RepID=A0A4D7QK15_9HYPH|nr:flagellin [Phreatobacter aquaticus]QCK85587.1 flagellin [Phreatobacter aquaticus]
MTMRVATFAMNDRMLSASLKTQARMAEMQLQESSGSVSTDYGGLGSSARQVIDLEVSITRSKSYSDAADEAGRRIETMYSALSSMTDLLSSFRSDLASALSTDSSASSTSTLAATAEQYLSEFSSLMNTQFEGRYLFAGTATTAKPVDLSSYVASDVDTADTSYYLGNEQIVSARISTDQTLAYGVTASDTGFEQALRALSLIANATGTLDETTLNAVSELAVSALDNVTATQSQLSVHAATAERASSDQLDFQDYAASSLSDLNGVDVAAVTVKLTAYQSQLEASYSALAKIQGLNLLTYLRG